MTSRDVRARMRKARTAWKALCRQRRADKRAAARLAERQEREIHKAGARAAERARKAEARAAEKANQRACKQGDKLASSRPVGRPPKPSKRKARWTDYQPGHARTVYHALRSWKIERQSHAAIGAFFGVCGHTIQHWRDRHPDFHRAIERGIFDRAELRAVVSQHRRVTVDPSTFNFKAKTTRGLLAKARVQIDYDHKSIERFGRSLHMRRRRGRGAVPEVDVLCAVEAGCLSGRTIAKALAISESTLRLWRKQDRDLDQAIRDAIIRERERLAVEAERLRIAALPHRDRVRAELADALARGLVAG